MNISKAKEMITDFRNNPAAVAPRLVSDQTFEVVKQYKNLGTIINDKSSFEPQVDAVCKNVNQWLYFFHKLRNFDVDKRFVTLFYTCSIESILTFSFNCGFK